MNLSNATIDKFSIHYVGNKSKEQKLIHSKKQVKVDEELAEKLQVFLLNKFIKLQEFYQFTHPSSLKFNVVYNHCIDIFEKKTDFASAAKEIASALFESSVHPKVKGGDVFVCHFNDCIINEISTNAIGIFKIENKSGFFEVNNESSEFSIQYKEGVDINKLDKGCLIFNTDKKNGYLALIIDSIGRVEEAQYWKNDFLNVKPSVDEYHFTKNFLSATKDFITSRLPSDFEVEKTDQINYLNKSVNYFRENETFNIKEFEKNVFEDAEIIKSFRKFGSSYLDQNDIDIADTFEISTQALKKQERIFKSVLKLDKNFHVYIHGRSDLLEKGYDNKKGKHYYKIYFDEEK